jgi:uncharacterized membrane protein
MYESYFMAIIILLVFFVIVQVYRMVGEHDVGMVVLKTNRTNDVFSLMTLLEKKGYKVDEINMNVLPFNVTLELKSR